MFIRGILKCVYTKRSSPNTSQNILFLPFKIKTIPQPPFSRNFSILNASANLCCNVNLMHAKKHKKNIAFLC